MSDGKASGSFIQSWLACAYTNAQWLELFGYMQVAGITKLIVQTTVDESSTETTPPSYSPTSMVSLYPSSIAGMTYCGNTPGAEVSPLESILMCAEASGVSVYIGLNFYEAAWFYDFNDRPFVVDTVWGGLESARGNSIAAEIYGLYQSKYPTAFAGWYWPWEVDNSAPFTYTSTQSALAAMMSANINFLATLGGGLPVIFSPFFNSSLGTPEQYASIWESVFSQVPVIAGGGIFAPQDGIGAGDVTLSELASWFGALQTAVAAQPGWTLWANSETFEVSGSTNITAPVSRVIEQFQAVAPYVSDIVTFAYCHYDTPLLSDPSIQAAWVAYFESRHAPQPGP